MEDVSMGMWVEQFNSSMATVQYSHNWKFCQYGCLVDYFTAHYQSPRQMICLWNKLVRGRAHCCNFRWPRSVAVCSLKLCQPTLDGALLSTIVFLVFNFICEFHKWILLYIKSMIILPNWSWSWKTEWNWSWVNIGGVIKFWWILHSILWQVEQTAPHV